MNYANSNAQTEPAAREREVPDQLDQLAHSVEMMADVAQRVVDRLAPVSQQNAPVGIGSGKDTAPEAVLCDVASRIRDAQQRVKRYAAQLEQALSRLEV
jgi:hypothetical protein